MHKIIKHFKSLVLVVVTATMVANAIAWSFSPNTVLAQIPTEDTSTGKPLVEYTGVESTIESYLCTPSNSGDGLITCINKLYRISVVIGGMLLVFFIVLAGYMYITGGENGKTKAKELIFSTLTGLAVILGSYVLLNFLNPALVEFRPIQPPIFTAANLPSCEDVGFTENCVLDGGQVYTAPTGVNGKGGCHNIEQGGCTRNTLNSCPGMAKNTELGLKICNQESAGGNTSIMSSTDKCQIQGTSEVVPFSGGLWQINILSSAQDFPDCKGALIHVSPGSDCRVRAPWNDVDCTCKYGGGGRPQYDKCVKALTDPVKNTAAACKLFNTRSSAGTEPGIRGWQPWSYSYKKCRS